MGRQVQPSSEDWAYLAGIIDGEGCITARRRHLSTPHCHPHLRIKQADEVFITELQQLFAVGRLHKSKPRHNSGSIVWAINKHTDLKWILENTLPYLRLKRKQAKLALKLASDYRVRNSAKALDIQCKITKLKQPRKLDS